MAWHVVWIAHSFQTQCAVWFLCVVGQPDSSNNQSLCLFARSTSQWHCDVDHEACLFHMSFPHVNDMLHAFQHVWHCLHVHDTCCATCLKVLASDYLFHWSDCHCEPCIGMEGLPDDEHAHDRLLTWTYTWSLNEDMSLNCTWSLRVDMGMHMIMNMDKIIHMIMNHEGHWTRTWTWTRSYTWSLNVDMRNNLSMHMHGHIRVDKNVKHEWNSSCYH